MNTTVLHKSIFGLLRLGFLSASFSLLFVSKSQSQVKFIFQDNFENAPVFSNSPTLGYTNWDETCCSWSFQNSDSAYRSSSKSGRFELRKSDPSPQQNDSKRTEMEWNGFAVPMGATWYAMSIMPAPYSAVDPAPEGVFQLHDKMPNNASSNWTNPFGIMNKNGRWTCHITYDVVNISTDGGKNIVSKEYDLGAVVPGKWVDWVLHTNYSWRDTGYVQVYKDGVKVVDYTGPCAYNGAMPDPYFKFGIYKWPWAISGFTPATTTSLRVFYFDNFRVGGRWNTINDFLIGGTTTTTTNQSPVANAGSDLTVILPSTTATLNGSASRDPDGTISKYAWTRVSGPNLPTFGNASAATTSISGLVAGTYTFNLTVTDNGGKTATDAVIVTVQASTASTLPTVSYYPNPVTSYTTLQVVGNLRGNAVLQIYSSTTGAMVQGTLLYIDQQTFTKNITTSNLPNGYYTFVLKFVNTTIQISQKLQKM